MIHNNGSLPSFDYGLPFHNLIVMIILQTLSYNGYLRFRIDTEPTMNYDPSTPESIQYPPLVHIVANGVLHLKYKGRSPLNSAGQIEVKMFEVSFIIP